MKQDAAEGVLLNLFADEGVYGKLEYSDGRLVGAEIHIDYFEYDEQED